MKDKLKFDPVKWCSHCRKIRSIEDFHNDTSRKSGRYPICAECSNAIRQKGYHKNLEHSRALKRKASRLRKQRYPNWYKEYYAKNSVKVCAATAEYQKSHPEVQKKARRKWIAANPEKWKRIWSSWRQTENGRACIRQNTHNYQARVRGAHGRHTAAEWAELKLQCGFTCAHCHRKEPDVKLTRDHIIPVSKGGSNWIANIQPLCVSCNSSKHDAL